VPNLSAKKAALRARRALGKPRALLLPCGSTGERRSPAARAARGRSYKKQKTRRRGKMPKVRVFTPKRAKHLKIYPATGAIPLD